jgi:sugar/nucleoside kinase (ribokinase family)
MGRALEIAPLAKRLGVPVVLDGGSWKPGTPALLGSTTVAVVSADFVVPSLGAGAAARDVLGFLADSGARWSAITNGPSPVVARLSDGAIVELPVPAVPPGQVVDTLGAGDVFHGALLAHLANGIVHGADLDNTLVMSVLERAIDAARTSVMHQGTRGWLAGS